jgi:hypothetical protein
MAPALVPEISARDTPASTSGTSSSRAEGLPSRHAVSRAVTRGDELAAPVGDDKVCRRLSPLDVATVSEPILPKGSAKEAPAMRFCTFALTCLLFITPGQAHADTAPNAVTDWTLIVQQSIHNASAPRPPASAIVLHATVILAMYDAAVAIEGGSESYGPSFQARPGADVRAAVATAAYLTARARVAASQFAYLDDQYSAYLASIPDGLRKTDGIRVGTRTSSLILRLRADDGFDNVVL